ncbi:Squalene epoxidase [Pichia californica]|nr:Squalene epoxidase [[Candida] californica]
MSNDIHYDAIVIGAGVVGPCLAKCLAGQGRKVLIVEREWTKPNRIVGELMQPSGLLALRRLGMAKAVNNIEAIPVNGYFISFYNDSVTIPYPEKEIMKKNLKTEPVPGAIEIGDEDKIATDSTLNMEEWEKSSTLKGVALHHGDFLSNLRNLCLKEKNVTKLDGNVTELIQEGDRITGIKVADKGEFKATLVFSCDGIYSKFRKELSDDYIPSIGSYFVGLDLVDAELPRKYHGHVILGKHAPVLIYQISPHHSRILCAYRSKVLPKKSEVLEYLKNSVLPNLPESVRPSFQKAYEGSVDGTSIYKAMPNQYLTARLNDIPGFICLGDSLNMRHPLTGGGMTVGLNDCALMCELLSKLDNEQLKDHSAVFDCMNTFHDSRKGLDVVINTLSIALYTLFAADNKSLNILQEGCFHYFLRGGESVNGPIGLLSGVIPKASVLFYHFFYVAFYSCWLNIQKKGIIGFPLALWENINALITACFVLLPFLSKEIFS